MNEKAAYFTQILIIIYFTFINFFIKYFNFFETQTLLSNYFGTCPQKKGLINSANNLMYRDTLSLNYYPKKTKGQSQQLM